MDSHLEYLKSLFRRKTQTNASSEKQQDTSAQKTHDILDEPLKPFIDLTQFGKTKEEQRKALEKLNSTDPDFSDFGQRSINSNNPSGYVTSTEIFVTSSAVMSEELYDYVFRNQEVIPVELAQKRIDKFRKKHPEYFEPLEKLEKKAYGGDLP